MARRVIWTKEILQTIEKLAKEGQSAKKIGEAIGVHPVTVRIKMHELGLSDHLTKYTKIGVTIEENLRGAKFEDICKIYRKKYRAGDKFKYNGKNRPIIEVSKFFMILGGGYRTCISFADLYVEDCRKMQKVA